MTTAEFIAREHERQIRLQEYVKDELRNMNINARMDFVIGLFTYLEPEIRELVRKGTIKGADQ